MAIMFHPVIVFSLTTAYQLPYVYRCIIFTVILNISSVIELTHMNLKVYKY